jgi:uncharacterized membrane protein YraQ (UPF0718 family)
MMMDKKKVLIIAGLIIAIIAGTALGFYFMSKWQAKKFSSMENSYSVVYLSTGEVYIGKLSFSSKMKLDNAYLLQTIKDSKDPSKDNFQLTPLEEALWAPKDLYLNSDHVIFYGPVKDDSKVVEALRNAGKK